MWNDEKHANIKQENDMSAGPNQGGGGQQGKANTATVSVKWVRVVSTTPPSGTTPVKRVIFQGIDTTSGLIRRGYFDLTAGNLRDVNKLVTSVLNTATTVTYDETANTIGYSYSDEFVIGTEQWSIVVTSPVPPTHVEAVNFA